MFTSITGRSVIVTGGTKGIGKGIARVMAKAGADVMITGRNQDDAERTVAELASLGTGRAAYFIGDVSSRAACDAMAAAAIESFGGIDIVCANAGPRTPNRQANRSVRCCDVNHISAAPDSRAAETIFAVPSRFTFMALDESDSHASTAVHAAA